MKKILSVAVLIIIILVVCILLNRGKTEPAAVVESTTALETIVEMTEETSPKEIGFKGEDLETRDSKTTESTEVTVSTESKENQIHAETEPEQTHPKVSGGGIPYDTGESDEIQPPPVDSAVDF